MILKNLLNSLNSDTLLILDIDSTLVETYHRNQAILDAFCQEMADSYPEDVAQIQQMQCRPNDYGYYSALKRQNVQFSSTAVEESLQAFWRQRFFSSDYLLHDSAYPGSTDFLRTVQQEGHPFCYLTGRYKAPMLKGTKASFDSLGFPYTEDQLILKEDPSEKDEVYKGRVLQSMSEKYKHIILIDNEPVILQYAAQHFPDIRLIWFESTHSGRMQPPTSADVIRSFDVKTQ